MRLVLERIAYEERGGMALTVLAFVPVAVAIAALLIDIGNGFTHRRHLQTQADAGVLAAAAEFSKCAADKSLANTAIERVAREYALTQNPQVGGDSQGHVQVAVNATDYGAADDSLGKPCDTGFIDLKLTNDDIPPFIALTGSQTVHAHARVKVFQVDAQKGLRPIAAEDPSPQVAKAFFVDEANGNVLASTPLSQDGTADGLVIWDNAASPVSVPISAGHVGLRIALGGGTSTTCGDPLVDCYDAGSPHGLVHIQGWSSSGTVRQDLVNKTQDAPLARSVSLYNGTCTDPYFSAAAASCTVGVRARVDFGGDPANVGGALTAVVAGTKYAFPAGNYDAATGTWSSGATIPIQPSAGPVDVQLDWKETKGKIGKSDCTKGNGCSDSFGVVQRDFSALDDRSGPIRLVQVSEGGSLWANSLQLGSIHSLVVKIGVKASLALQNATSGSEAPTALRVVSGSQTQSLDCDPLVSSLKDELATGCAPKYTINTGTGCPSSPGTLWSSPQPWSCVAVQTGAAKNQVAAGLNERILGDAKPSSCTAPNQWSSFPNIDPGDPRLVKVLVTPFGTFNGSGSDTKPVTNMAIFYITGWTGQGNGFDNPCQGNGDDPVTETGTIVGHFLKYVQPNDDSDPSTEKCDFSLLGSCVAVLVE